MSIININNIIIIEKKKFNEMKELGIVRFKCKRTSEYLDMYSKNYSRFEDKVVEEEGIAPYCPYCNGGEYLHNEDGNENNYCGHCGTKLDWSDIESEEQQ